MEDFSFYVTNWYKFPKAGDVLYIGNDCFAAMNGLRESVTNFCSVSIEESISSAWQKNHRRQFACIISIAEIEKYQSPTNILREWRNLLTTGGVLLLGMNNRLGLRYFCGDRDPYTGRNFDGVENYRRAYMKNEDKFDGRMYDKAEIEKMLNEAGWCRHKFYSVLPDLKNPFLIFADGYLPNENLAARLFPTYNFPNTVFIEEEMIYPALMENGMFHQMANAYLIECAPDGNFSDVSHVTCSIERGEKNALFTVIHGGTAEKRAIFPAGKERLATLAANMDYLAAHGLVTVKGDLQNDRYTMPYIKAETGQIYLKQLLLEDKEKFLAAMDRFRDEILRSSETVSSDKGDGWGATLARGFLDMVPLNSFFVNGEFVFYDQEFSYVNFPANAVIYRMASSFFAGNGELTKILSPHELFDRYGLTEQLSIWQRIDGEFIAALRKLKDFAEYHKKVWRNADVVNANRQRMNYSADEYQRLFVDIFHNADTRKLIVFGSGNFARKFLALFKYDYSVYAIIDNNKDKWGEEIAGIAIQSPDILKNLGKGEYKIIICIKDYLSVMKQLDALGIVDYGIYDPNKNYPRKRKPIASPTEQESSAQKKYHTGYIAGVFDLFHIGHLNMFRRAKEQCEYLIVGVVTDDGVREGKKVEPFVPFAERVEMVKSCRYVDEVVEIPSQYADTDMAWRLHNFDVQFSGSDYEHDPVWLAKKKWLEDRGSTMIFFPYTQSTSSTKIKQLIEKRLV